MKRFRFLSAALIAAVAVSAFAEETSSVQNLTVRQRWPWSQKVDIDYLYTGSQTTSLVFKATWQGQSEPVELGAAVDTASLQKGGGFMVRPGQNSFTWDPVAAGYGDRTLEDFKVTVAPGSDPRTYLVLDLVDGGYTFLADVPEGGWSDDYRKTKMVFRRIPAGTYTLGHPLADLEEVTGVTSGFDHAAIKNSAVRSVTLSSDYYFAIFLVTGSQLSCIGGSAPNNFMTPEYYILESAGGGHRIRGQTLPDGTTTVDWPITGYKVGEGSIVDRMRKISSKTGQPELRIDLATETQWEVAMRTGTTTFFPNGGTKDNTVEELAALLAEISSPKYETGKNAWETKVGTDKPNAWGIYDFNVRQELCLDWSECTGGGYYGQYSMNSPPSGLDPIGQQTGVFRVIKGYEANMASFVGSSLLRTHTAWRYSLKITGGQYNGCMRFAIHLKPLVDVE